MAFYTVDHEPVCAHVNEILFVADGVAQILFADLTEWTLPQSIESSPIDNEASPLACGAGHDDFDRPTDDATSSGGTPAGTCERSKSKRPLRSFATEEAKSKRQAQNREA